MAKSEKKISIASLDKVLKEQAVDIATEQWFGNEVKIKHTLSFSEALAFVDDVVSSCFHTTGGYMPELQEFVVKSNILTRYANFNLPDNLEHRYSLLYNTDAVDVVIRHINQKQLDDILESISEKISYLCESNIAATEVVRLDDVSVNLDNYSTTEQMNEAIATAIANKVDKVDGKGLSTEDFTTTLKEKLVALPEGAEANYVKSVSDEFTVSAEGKLEVKEVAPAKVTGLPDALAGKVDKVAGKGLSANDYTDEEKEKLGGVEAGANKNLIEIIKLAGAALNISEKAVNIPFAGDTAGVVTSSTGENKVAVAEDGSMEVNSLNMNKLVQSDGDTLILDGGNAAV